MWDIPRRLASLVTFPSGRAFGGLRFALKEERDSFGFVFSDVKPRSRDVTDPVTLQLDDVAPQLRVDLTQSILKRLKTNRNFKKRASLKPTLIYM